MCRLRRVYWPDDVGNGADDCLNEAGITLELACVLSVFYMYDKKAM